MKNKVKKALGILEKVKLKTLNFEKLTPYEEKVQKVVFAFGCNEWGAKFLIKSNLLTP